MSDTEKTNLRQNAESAFFWWRLIMTILTVLVAAWIQFLGPGVRGVLKDFLGITEVVERLVYIEKNMPAPSVTEWVEAASGQIGECTHASCPYRLVASRTEFGEGCGKPYGISIYLRGASGRQTRISHTVDWTPIELTRTPEEFIIPLQIPPQVRSGQYFWRSRHLFPDCVGPTEPIPRYSPWFPLNIAE